MADATCKTCPFYGPFPANDGALGTCRRYPPRPMMTESGGDHPELTHENAETAASWWCGEHPARQRDRLAADIFRNLVNPDACTKEDLEVAAELAYEGADAFLAAREKGAGRG